MRGPSGVSLVQRHDQHALPTGEEKTRAVRSMFDAIAGRYEMVNKLMTLGLDARWRRRAVRDLRLPDAQPGARRRGGYG